MTKRQRPAQRKPAQANPVAAAVAGILALPAVKAEMARRQQAAAIGQQLLALSNAGRAFGADIQGFTADQTLERCGALRRDLARMTRELDQLEALVAQPADSAKAN